MSPWSCLIFFPASQPELLPKALATGAGRVCADLEDAVPAEGKADARAAVMDLIIDEAVSARLVVRINHPADPEGRLDLEGLGGTARTPASLRLMVPKVDSPADLEMVRDGLGARPTLIPVIETARGLANVEAIAAADGVSAVIMGGLDLSVELGCALEWDALLYARSRCVHAARLAGVEAVDTPFFDLEDAGGLRSEAEKAYRLGFDAKAAIHPSQVDIIHHVFEPTPEEIERAHRVLDAVEKGARGVFVVDGTMVDRPAIQAARRIAQRWASRAARDA